MAVNRILVGDIEITEIYNLTSGNVNLTTSLLNDVLEMDTLDCDFNSQLDSSTILATIGEKVVYYHGDQQRQMPKCELDLFPRKLMISKHLMNASYSPDQGLIKFLLKQL